MSILTKEGPPPTATLPRPSLGEERRIEGEEVRQDATVVASSFLTSVVRILADVTAVAVALLALTIVRPSWGAAVVEGAVWPVGVMLLISFAAFRLYQPLAFHPAEELRRTGFLTGIVFLVYGTALLTAGSQNAVVVFVYGAALVFAIPFFRSMVRVICAGRAWWGTPVVVLAKNGTGEAVIRTLRRWPELGLKPVAVLADREDVGSSVGGVPVIGESESAPFVASKYKVPYAIAVLDGLSRRQKNRLVARYAKFFERVFVVPSSAGTYALWNATTTPGGLMGYAVRHRSWSRASKFAKRTVDVIGAAATMLIASPLLLTIAAAVKLDSRGPVFFRQVRVGERGKCFTVLKFRSMTVDADRSLEQLLEQSPHMRSRYERFHKLENDPRVTRVGRILRRFSLDELPQLWNVLRGEMSLVGPRAYLPRELSHMIGLEQVVLQNTPGLTGLWQVSGRNALSFKERVEMDAHYMQNWTPWLDLYILVKTIPVVMSGDGAQ